jgi:hypothetical protein
LDLNGRRCTVLRCDKPHIARGLCSTHYYRLLRRGTVHAEELPAHRFWSQVDKCGPLWDGSPCWVWTGRLKEGYGRFTYNGHRTKSHRIAYWLTHGVWNRLHVLHRCDNPACVNPKHLFTGTQQDNLRDCIAKGRRSPNQSFPSKITQAKLILILEMRSSGMRVNDIAVITGFTRSYLHLLFNGHRAKCLTL